VALLAGAFGIATVVSGGRVALGAGDARAAAVHYVPFVVWFNFLAGFAYLAAAAGIALARRWAAPLSALIAAATALAFLFFGAHVAAGGAHEARTTWAMALRTAAWAAIAWWAWRPRRLSAPGAPPPRARTGSRSVRRAASR
jgi:hypothetical protein